MVMKTACYVRAHLLSIILGVGILKLLGLQEFRHDFVYVLFQRHLSVSCRLAIVTISMDDSVSDTLPFKFCCSTHFLNHEWVNSFLFHEEHTALPFI